MPTGRHFSGKDGRLPLAGACRWCGGKLDTTRFFRGGGRERSELDRPYIGTVAICVTCVRKALIRMAVMIHFPPAGRDVGQRSAPRDYRDSSGWTGEHVRWYGDELRGKGAKWRPDGR